MATKKELSIDDHNKLVAEKVAKLKKELDEAQKEFKSESCKPQASLAECNAMLAKHRELAKKAKAAK